MCTHIHRTYVARGTESLTRTPSLSHSLSHSWYIRIRGPQGGHDQSGGGGSKGASLVGVSGSSGGGGGQGQGEDAGGGERGGGGGEGGRRSREDEEKEEDDPSPAARDVAEVKWPPKGFVLGLSV